DQQGSDQRLIRESRVARRGLRQPRKGEGNEGRYPPRVRDRDRALFLRKRVHDPFDQVRAARRALLAVSPVLHRQAEAGGRGRPRRAFPAAVRQPPVTEEEVARRRGRWRGKSSNTSTGAKPSSKAS